MSVRPEQIAAIACREWLLLGMPAKVAEVNATRAASLKSPWAGPFTIGASATLGINVTASSDTYVNVALTAGSRTTTQVAAEINATSGLSGVASVDSADRLVLTSPSAPTTSAVSKLFLRGSALDANTVFGFTRGGERCVTTALVAPGNQDVIDGWPLLSDLCSRGPGTVVVILGDKVTKEAANIHKDQHTVTMDISVLRIEPQQQVHRTREHIYAAIRCVRELVVTTTGRQFGKATVGDIMRVRLSAGRVVAKPFSFGNKEGPNPLFDAAIFNASIDVYERPAS